MLPKAGGLGGVWLVNGGSSTKCSVWAMEPLLGWRKELQWKESGRGLITSPSKPVPDFPPEDEVPGPDSKLHELLMRKPAAPL